MRNTILSLCAVMAKASDNGSNNGGGGDASGGDKKQAALVKLRVCCASLGEDENVYARGDVFETTAERAKALGDMVEKA